VAREFGDNNAAGTPRPYYWRKISARVNLSRVGLVVNQVEIYKGYNIRVFESFPGKWTAKVRKVDGSRIQILPPGLEDDAQDCLTTDPETMNAEAAIY
jgi:hypothetical protein